jgi:hypothetical protein
MTRVLVVISLVVGLGLEITILSGIFDPQGAWRESEYARVGYYGTVAALPYLAAFGWFIFSLAAPSRAKIVLRYTACMAVAGVVIAFFALRQDAHSAAGILPIGFILQWLVLSIPLIAALWTRLHNSRK